MIGPALPPPPPRPAPRSVRFPLAIAITAALGFGAVPNADAAATVDDGVRRALAESAAGNTYVVVMLAPVAGDQVATEEEVPRRQARVMAALEPGDFTPVYRYRTFAAMTGVVSASGLERLAARPEVERVMLDGTGEGALTSSVPYIMADQAYALGFTGANITVAVLDTGIDTDNINLSDDVAPGAWHFLQGGFDVGPGAEDDNGHGSNVSGIITSRGISSGRGVAPDADILAIKVLDATSSGYLSDWAAGVDHVVANRLSYPNLVAINMSLVSFALYTSCPCDAFEPVLQAAIDAAKSVGIATFASSGNNGTTNAMPAPACNSAAIPVAAVYDQSLGREPDSGTYQTLFGGGFGNCYDANAVPGLITCFSCRNACNELAAPGRNITAPYWTGGLATYTGTSQAAPHVAGVAALVREARLDYGLPSLAPDPLLSLLKATGSNATDFLNIQPIPRIVNALTAVNSAVPPQVAVVFPNGGEQLLIGSTVDLLWNASDNIGVNRVDLQFSTNGPGGPFTNIATNLANSGSYPWVVTGTPSADCRLRVTARDAGLNSAVDLSDAAFEILDPTTATTIALFEGWAAPGGIRLRWRFADPGEFVAVAVERAPGEDGPWLEVATERSTAGGLDEALDTGVEPGRTYHYRLAGTDRAGLVTRFAPLAATAGEAIASLAFAGVAPNPSPGPTVVEYVVPRAAEVGLRVLDVQGRVVATLASGPSPAGRHRATWSGIGVRGPAPAGLYFVELRSAGVVRSRRLVLAP